MAQKAILTPKSHIVAKEETHAESLRMIDICQDYDVKYSYGLTHVN